MSQQKVEDLISFVKTQGEGKGRLTLNQNQYLFSFEAIFNDHADWILSASIPLHGEEVLKFQNLREKKIQEKSFESFERRIEEGIKDYLRAQNKSPGLAKLFIQELRSIMRIMLYQKLGLEISCSDQKCQMGDSFYQVEKSSGEFSLKKDVNSEYEIVVINTNLTESIFKRTKIILHSQNLPPSAPSLLSLELFWN